MNDDLRARIKDLVDKLLIKEHQRAYSHTISIFVVTALEMAEANSTVADLLETIESRKQDSPEKYHSAIESLLEIVRSISKSDKDRGGDPERFRIDFLSSIAEDSIWHTL